MVLLPPPRHRAINDVPLFSPSDIDSQCGHFGHVYSLKNICMSTRGQVSKGLGLFYLVLKFSFKCFSGGSDWRLLVPQFGYGLASP